MARIRQNMHYSDTRAELSEYKDARRGAVEDAFWDEDELVEYPSSRAKKKRTKKKYPGCPENDGKAHVYIWIDYISWWNYSTTYEIKVCCGCQKRSPSRKAFRKKQ